MSQGKSQILPVNLKETRGPLEKIQSATGSDSLNDCIRQIIRQLEKEMQQGKVKEFAYRDIKIVTPQ